MRLIGPNCLGVMNPVIGMNATFAKDAPKAGNVAFLSQSGALLTAILDWSHKEEVGFSAIVSTGSMLDVGWGDLIYLLRRRSAHEEHSALHGIGGRCAVVSVGGPRSGADQADHRHQGGTVGSGVESRGFSYRRAHWQRRGAGRGLPPLRRVARAQHRRLFYMAEVLGKQPRPKGPRLTILTNAGGPGVLATDALVANGGELAKLSEATLQKLDEFLPAHWSHGNPVDILGDADSERYAKAIEIAAQDPNSDGLLVVLAPQGMTDPYRDRGAFEAVRTISGKPLLASWMGGTSVAEGEAILNSAGIPTFPYPDTAARAFTYMWRYTENLRSLYETPSLAEGQELDSRARRQSRKSSRTRARAGVCCSTNSNRSKFFRIMAFRRSRRESRAAKTKRSNMRREIGFPVVLKVFSDTITHKTDVGGVKLNLQDEAAVRKAYQAIRSSVAEKAGASQFGGVTVQPMVKLDGYELILGSSVDPQFGPVLLFGSGGQLVEVYKDSALALPPLNTTLAQRLMEQTQIFKALKGVRGRKPVDLAALESLLVRFSQLVIEQSSIAEIDINPLIASPERLLALDARIVLHDPAKLKHVPKPAIRPYPMQYVSKWTMKDGT